MYKEITKCRISSSTNLINVLSLGNQYLTGVFPKTKEEKVTIGPVDLVWCPDSGLLQMKQSYSLDEMYGDNYGYRSGLNASMVKHLHKKIKTLEILAKPTSQELIIDIGSNDATSLKAYSGKLIRLAKSLRNIIQTILLLFQIFLLLKNLKIFFRLKKQK